MSMPHLADSTLRLVNRVKGAFELFMYELPISGTKNCLVSVSVMLDEVADGNSGGEDGGDSSSVVVKEVGSGWEHSVILQVYDQVHKQYHMYHLRGHQLDFYMGDVIWYKPSELVNEHGGIGNNSAESIFAMRHWKAVFSPLLARLCHRPPAPPASDELARNQARNTRREHAEEASRAKAAETEAHAAVNQVRKEAQQMDREYEEAARKAREEIAVEEAAAAKEAAAEAARERKLQEARDRRQHRVVWQRRMRLLRQLCRVTAQAKKLETEEAKKLGPKSELALEVDPGPLHLSLDERDEGGVIVSALKDMQDGEPNPLRARGLLPGCHLLMCVTAGEMSECAQMNKAQVVALFRKIGKQKKTLVFAPPDARFLMKFHISRIQKTTRLNLFKKQNNRIVLSTGSSLSERMETSTTTTTTFTTTTVSSDGKKVVETSTKSDSAVSKMAFGNRPQSKSPVTVESLKNAEQEMLKQEKRQRLAATSAREAAAVATLVLWHTKGVMVRLAEARKKSERQRRVLLRRDAYEAKKVESAAKVAKAEKALRRMKLRVARLANEGEMLVQAEAEAVKARGAAKAEARAEGGGGVLAFNRTIRKGCIRTMLEFRYHFFLLIKIEEDLPRGFAWSGWQVGGNAKLSSVNSNRVDKEGGEGEEQEGAGKRGKRQAGEGGNHLYRGYATLKEVLDLVKVTEEDGENESKKAELTELLNEVLHGGGGESGEDGSQTAAAEVHVSPKKAKRARQACVAAVAHATTAAGAAAEAVESVAEYLSVVSVGGANGDGGSQQENEPEGEELAGMLAELPHLDLVGQFIETSLRLELSACSEGMELLLRGQEVRAPPKETIEMIETRVAEEKADREAAEIEAAFRKSISEARAAAAAAGRSAALLVKEMDRILLGGGAAGSADGEHHGWRDFEQV
jgi:hypothetical protein